MDEMLNGDKILEMFFSVSEFSMIYLSWLKSIFKLGIFSKATFAGSNASSSLIIICSIEFERFGFFCRGVGVLEESFNLDASVPLVACVIVV